MDGQEKGYTDINPDTCTWTDPRVQTMYRKLSKKKLPTIRLTVFKDVAQLIANRDNAIPTYPPRSEGREWVDYYLRKYALDKDEFWKEYYESGAEYLNWDDDDTKDKDEYEIMDKTKN